MKRYHNDNTFMKRKLRQVGALQSLLLVALAVPVHADEPTLASRATSLLGRFCTDCHGAPDEFPEGGFSLAADFAKQPLHETGPILKKALDAVEGFEMPPADGDQPTVEERQQLAGALRGLLARPEFGDRRNPGKPVLRRLTRLEYNNTVRDLLGLETDVFMFPERQPFSKEYFNPAAGKMPSPVTVRAREYGAKYPVLLPHAGLPGDNRAEHGFTNRGDAQNLSAMQLEQYVELAEQIAFHPELLSRAERLQEIFPQATSEPLPTRRPAKPKRTHLVNAVGRLARNNNVVKALECGDSSPLSFSHRSEEEKDVTTSDDGSKEKATTSRRTPKALESFRQRLETAFAEDRGGVYDVSENPNSTIPGKGGVLQLAYGHNANRVLGVNPSEDIWNAAFATAEESSGDVLFTNKVKGLKKFFFGFHPAGGQKFNGIAEVGIVVLSRRGQTGTVRVTAEFDGGDTKSIAVTLKEGAGTDNTFVSFAAPVGKSIRRLAIDGSEFSGDFVLLDDLAFITHDKPSAEPGVTGRELPYLRHPAAGRRQDVADTKRRIDKSIANRPPRERLAHFMQRAFRRPVDSEEVDLYHGLYESSLAAGANDEAAMRSAIHGVLSSPSFLYLLECGDSSPLSFSQPSEQKETVTTTDDGLKKKATTSRRTPKALTDHELATRLSYFLWSSMPDDELLRLAGEGHLNDDRVLEEQVRRMLKNPRVRELSESFFVEWLRLRELWSAQPDKRQFAEFYRGPKGKDTVADDMFCEALLLFETILVEDRSIVELVHSDQLYLNERLAKLYGIEEQWDDERNWKRVQLPSADRGGVLTMGATLTLSSFPHRTSPIRRGAWFLETAFNRPPPPPKIAVADIDEQEGLDENLTLRQKTELHRAKAVCAICHDRIDPPGFAFENYDAIGRWREKDGEERVDPSGELRGLGKFSNAAEFKMRLLENKERFVRGFVEHLLSYALARKLEYYDTRTVEEIVEAAAKDDYRFSRVVVEIVKSPTFRNFGVR